MWKNNTFLNFVKPYFSKMQKIYMLLSFCSKKTYMQPFKKNGEILHEWQKKFTFERASGAKKEEAYRIIAKAYNVSPWTVRYYLDPRYKDSNLNSKRKQYKKRVRLRRYQRNYHRLLRRPERYLATVFEGRNQLTVDKIASCTPDFFEGVHFRSDTIKKQLDRYTTQQRGPPYIQEVKPGVYAALC